MKLKAETLKKITKEKFYLLAWQLQEFHSIIRDCFGIWTTSYILMNEEARQYFS